jgi:hypothetical protein
VTHARALAALAEGLDGARSWPGDRRPIALDIAGQHAAVLVFGVDARGRWSYDIVEAAFEAPHGWSDRGSGGAHGDGWELPWPTDGWPDGPLIDLLGSIGRGGLDADDSDLGVIEGEHGHAFVLAVAGFVAPQVTRLNITDGAGVARAAVFEPERAFVRLGIAPLRLSAYDVRGRLLEERVVGSP